MLEVEKRVLLSSQQLKKLKSFLSSKAERVNQFKRFTMINIKNSDFTPSPDSTIDLKVRVMGGKGLFTVKTGNWHSDASRKESEVTFDPTQIKELLQILVSLGLVYFVVTYVLRSKYNHKGLIITLDEYYGLDASLLEVEKLAKSKREAGIAEKEIKSFLKEHNFKSLESKETIAFIAKMNVIKKLQVNFTKTTVDSWFTKWKLFIQGKK